MAFITRLAAALALILTLAAPAAAQALNDAQQKALQDRVDAFDESMRVSDMAGVMGVIPPRVLDKIASTYGITTADLIASAQQQIDEALKSIKIESFGMDLDAAESVALDDGTLYALIPTETVMDLGTAGKHRSRTSTLAVLDEGTWYLMAVDDPQQIAIFKEVYPNMADIEFPKATMEVVTE